MYRVGIDTGGTFTDFVLFDGTDVRFHKVPSTPADPSESIMSGLEALLGPPPLEAEIVHGTTVATNALLQRKGARVALVTTKGFEDVIEIGRQERRTLYDFFWRPVEPLVPPELRFGVDERTAFDGEVLKGFDPSSGAELRRLIEESGAEVVAVSLLHSYANPQNEAAVAQVLAPMGLPMTVSSGLLPEFREYERTSTVVLNSYLIPLVQDYMRGLGERLRGARVFIMQSSGGVLTPDQAGGEPVKLLLSGPAGGVVGAFGVAEAIGYPNVITYDMGGTSTDVYLCSGKLEFTTGADVDGLPVKTPMINVTTIGAGGGSIAYMDTGGALKVGPRSAGASPGPACYGVGTEPTVTDANVVLGRIVPEWFLGGRMVIDPGLSERAVEGIAGRLGLGLPETAEGIIRVTNSNMEHALRVISMGRGHDPRDYALVSFGGGGGLHACELARSMGITTVVFPVSPGTLSAMGMLMADSFKDYSVTSFYSGAGEHSSIEDEYERLAARARVDFPDEQLHFERFLDVRYKRQSHELTIPYSARYEEDFHESHRSHYGYSRGSEGIEVVTLRLRAVLRKQQLVLPKMEATEGEVVSGVGRVYFAGEYIPARMYKRGDFYPGYEFEGPCIVLEETSTLFVPPGFGCEVDGYGNIIATDPQD